MIIQAYLPLVGGAERQLASLAPLLRSRGVDLYIVTRKYSGLKSYECINDIPVYRLVVSRFKFISSLSYTVSGVLLLGRKKPDIIHAHEMLSPAIIGIISKKLFRIPVVLKVLRGGVLGDITKLKNKRLGRLRLLLIKKYVDYFITISHEIDEELKEIGIPISRRIFIPNGVDTSHFIPLPEEVRNRLRISIGFNNDKVVVFAGRLTKEKRVDSLVNIWPRIRLQFPNATLLILGAGNEEDNLKRLAGDGIVFLGLVDNVAPYFQIADLFVLPSVTEGLSNAMLEAMSSGLPILATRVGGTSDIIEHGKSGWLIPPDDMVSLERGLVILLDDNNLRKEMGRLARERVISDYSLTSVADRIFDLYEMILQKE